jgi:hypothetical protein
MAPRRGFCPVDAMAAPRRNPLVARAGRGVLVAGGFDGDGEPVTSVERYDPDRGGFVAVAGSFYDGLAGATMTALPDGRVVVAGGSASAYQVYDPRDDSIGQTLFLEGARAFHTAAALPDGRLLLAGGCGDVTAAGDCDFGDALTDSILLDVDTGAVTTGPGLAVARAGGSAVVEADGRVVLAGGVGATGEPVMQAERIDPSGGPGQGIAAVQGRPAILASGAVLTAFADAVGTDAVAVIPPAGSSAVALPAASQPRTGATLTPLDDGAVLAIGGLAGAGDDAALYSPALESFASIAAPFALRDHAAVRLDDGAVLIAGGRDDAGEVVAGAWIYRHDLTGRFTAELSLAADTLSARDPSRVTREVGPVRYVVTGSNAAADLPSEWVVGGGPRFVDPIVQVRGYADGGGLAVLFGFESPRDYLFAAAAAGEPVRVYRARSGVRSNALCTGVTLAATALDPRTPTPTLELRALDDQLTILLDDAVVAECELDEPAPRGAVGAGVLGDATATITIESLIGRR